MAGNRILVIEDDLPNLRLMQLLLKAAGHEVFAAENGESGVAAACRERPDLVLCDGYMPDIDGFEVVKRIRADGALTGMRVVAVTGLARPGETDRLLAAGFNGYIAKPFDIKTFASEVARFLG